MLNTIGVVADILGIVSAIIGVITFFTTRGIRKSLLKHTEKSDYINDIDSQINNLISHYDTLNRDNSLYTIDLLDRIDAQLDDIQILYETILPRLLLKDIANLREIIKRCSSDLSDISAKRECKQKLSSIITKLRKEKKVVL